MASLRTPSNLALVHITSVPGITAEDVEELRVLGIVSVQNLMGAMDATSGNLQSLSNDHAVVEPEQAQRIGDALLAYERVPEAWRNRWVSTTPPAPAPATEIPAPAPAPQPSLWTRIKEAWSAA
jgi:hypothetical protein